MLSHHAIPFAIAALMAPLLHAATPGDDPSVLIEREIQRFRVAADGSYDVSNEVQMLLNTDKAVQDNGQYRISLNKKLDSLSKLEAYTLKADGRKVMVAADQIKTQVEPATAGAPMFADSEYRIVVFPELAVGDRIHIDYALKRQPLLPGHFEDRSVPEFHPYKQASLSYDLPKGLALYSAARGYTAKPAGAEADRQLLAWEYDARPKARIEAFSVAYSDYGDSHYVSTYKDWSELAQAYEKAASAKALPTDKIKTLAQQLTAEAKTPRAKALLLSDWVRKNIRYVALWLGRDGVVPHAAESVLDNRYGDCKDHATLLLAMLKAVDIDGSTALINQGNRYQLPAVPVLSAFNHAIVYLPELDLYLDPTATVIAAGFLPVPELDKPVLLTKLGKLGHTPAVQRNDSDSQYTMALGSDGSAELKGDQHIAGALAELNRYILNNLPEAQKSKMVSNLLRTQNLTGDGQMLLNGKQDQPDQQSITITAHIDSLASLPGPVGMPTLTSLGGGIAANLQSFLSEASRSQPFACVPSKVREEVRFTLPKGVSINSLPKPLKLDDRYFAYQASYRQDGQAVLVQREMAVKPQSHLVCTAEDFTAMLPALKQMARDVSSQIIVAAE